MKRTYIFAGASSKIALSTARLLIESENSNNNSCEIIGITRGDENKIYSKNYSIDSYHQSDYPDLDIDISGIAYFPGSINLKPVSRITSSDIINDFNINSLGAFLFTQKYLGNLKRVENSSILYFSTVACSIGLPFHSSITMAKSALEGLTISLASELAPKIRVNCIAPSLVHSPLSEKLLNSEDKIISSQSRNPLNKIGTPNEIGEIAAFLLSQKSSWITGQILSVDGGMGKVKNK
ncbi:MAG TPA: SDR family oxidoreductase [Oligoflexia bacterium]|nr:SDR family oxidoreductase [Oligoflexia bacterium]HMP49479.1 SDR family oxidoreductase [Oligoflexia bacterium]